MKHDKLEESSIQMSSASFIKDPYPSNTMMYQIDLEVFSAKMEHYLKDNSFKIMGILLDKKYAVFVHRDVLRYMIKILKYSKEDLKKHII